MKTKKPVEKKKKMQNLAISVVKPPRPLGKIPNRELVKEAVGRGGQWIWDTLVGSGDYAIPNFKTKKNSLMEAITANGPPSMHTTVNRSVRVKHREYLGDVVTGGSGAFNLASYKINPGVNVTFPWLSTLAVNFQQYRILGMVFEFLSTSADALSSTNTQLGSTILATNYNVAQPNFINKLEMENTEFCSSQRQSKSILHPIECKPSLTTAEVLYIRPGAVPNGQDPRLYDLGNFQIATFGQQGANIDIGELWVSYDIELLKPITFDYEIATSDHFILAYQASGNVATVTSNVNNTLGTVVSVLAAAITISLPIALPGDIFLVTCTATLGSAVAVPVVTPTSTNPVGGMYIFTSSTGVLAYNYYMQAPPGASVASNFILNTAHQVIQTATPTPGTIKLTFGSYTLTGGYGDLIITRMNANQT